MAQSENYLNEEQNLKEKNKLHNMILIFICILLILLQINHDNGNK